MPRLVERYQEVWRNLSGEDVDFQSRRQLAAYIARRISTLTVPGSTAPIFTQQEIRRFFLTSRNLLESVDQLFMLTLKKIEAARPDISQEELYDLVVQAQNFSPYYTEIVQAMIGWLHLSPPTALESLENRRNWDKIGLHTYDNKTASNTNAVAESLDIDGYPGPFRVFRRTSRTGR